MAGPYAVGYRVEFAVDGSRTWRVTRRYEQTFSADLGGRPVRISVWYPAAPVGGAHRMRYGDYAHAAAPPQFAAYEARLEQRDSVIATLTVQPNEVSELLGVEVSAYRDAPTAAGRFPLVLVVAGQNGETTEQAVLAEFLASHGYVVATVPWTGVDEGQFDASRTQPGLETVARDVEFAWARLRSERGIDGQRLAVLGHSLGGVVAAIVGMRNADVGAVIGLDATYGFAGATAVLTGFYGYSNRSLTSALLDLRKAEGEQDTRLDLSAVHAFHYAERYLVTLRHIRHSEFTTYALISGAFNEPPIPPQFQSPGWTRQTAYHRYQDACRMVRDFLDMQLRGDSDGVNRLVADVAASEGAVLAREAALPPPPLPADLVALASRGGFDAATHVLDYYAHEAPGDVIVSEADFNNLGYALLGQRRHAQALIAFRLAIYVHPHSANAHDSYGDGLLAAGDTVRALAAYQRALELAPADSSLDSSSRTDLIRTDSAHVRQLGRPKP